jgi:hypothetical protein
MSANDTIITDKKIVINGKEIPEPPCKRNNTTMINDKIYIGGYEYKNGKWKRTLKAFWYLFF